MKARRRIPRTVRETQEGGRRHAQEVLRRSEARFRRLLEMIPLPLFFVDQDDAIVFHNEHFVQILGYSAEEVPTVREWLARAYPDLAYRQEVVQKWQTAVWQAIQQNADIAPAEYRVTCKNGEERIFEISGIVLGGGLLTTFTDLTARKRAEQALRESEERYRQIVEGLNLGIVIHVNGQAVYGNSSALRLIGAAHPEELLGRPVLEFVHPEDREFIFSLMQSAFLSDLQSEAPLLEPLIVTERLIRLDGTVITVEASAVLINYYGQPALMVMLNDITEREQALLALRESEERMRGFLMSDVFGALYGDIYGNVKMANDEFLRIVGCSREELAAGKVRWTDLTPPEFLPLDEIAIAQAKAHGACQPYEKQFVRKDGSRIWVLVGFTLVGAEREESTAFIFDLTNLKQKEEEIRKLNAELEQRVCQRTQELENANQELEAFTYSVSHDLRAPLRAISGFSEVLAEDYAAQIDSEGRRLLGVIRANTTKMDRLITALLALSRTTRGELRSVDIDMTALAQMVYQEVSSPETRCQFDFCVSPLPPAYGDPALIRQVWSNLLANAIKYTLPRSDRRIEVGGRIENGMNVYYVKDSGVGFDPAYADKLFGVFQRLHRPEEFEGSGVGLAIVQRIVRRHAGRTWAEGRPNQGATFYFSLPGEDHSGGSSQ